MSFLGQVIIFKTPNDNEKEKDVYSEILSSQGFQVVNVPVLDFEFVNLEKLSTKLTKFRDYSGIIFSSPRCVKACTLAAGDAVLREWENRRNFAVGETTGKIAESIGLGVEGTEAGNANALADIISKDKYSKPFLYPIGSLTNNTFKDKLNLSNIKTDDIVVYKTKPHSLLKERINSLVDKLLQPVYFLYFSPSGINFTLPVMEEFNFDISSIRFVAFGPTTEKALKEHGLNVFRTVSKPTPAAAVEALTS